MPVLLRRPGDLPDESAFDRWVAVAAPPLSGAKDKRVRNLGHVLEKTFEDIAGTWQEIAGRLARDNGDELSHMVVCAPNASDFGLMLAWSRLVETYAGEDERTLMICGDPWLFRHLARFEGVAAGAPPGLWRAECRLRLRGLVARLVRCARLIGACVRLRAWRHKAGKGAPAILVYGHPTSRADGYDGYFGNIPQSLPRLNRLLHTDCAVGLGLRLSGQGHAAPLHAWGSIAAALTALGTLWRPRYDRLDENYAWLIRRAAKVEGGTAQAAAIAWQNSCQERWLEETRPRVIAWPWENHAWERALVRAARRRGVRTVGYQHSVVGRHMINYSSRSNADGLESIPDLILCTGTTTLEQLASWGVPRDRLKTGGAARMPETRTMKSQPEGAVFLSLPFDGATAAQMVEAGRNLIRDGFRFVVKDHPMTPFRFDETDGMTRTDAPFHEHEDLRALVYAASAVGLESALAGLPTIRFRPDDRIALDILPQGYALPTAGREDLGEALHQAAPPPPMPRDAVFAAVDLDVWRKELQ